MKNLPAELLTRLYLTNSHGMKVHAYELDDEEANLDKVRFLDTATDDRGYQFHLVRYTATDGINRLCALFIETEPTTEDFAEWCASSCGMTYNAYINKPWMD